MADLSALAYESYRKELSVVIHIVPFVTAENPFNVFKIGELEILHGIKFASYSTDFLTQIGVDQDLHMLLLHRIIPREYQILVTAILVHHLVPFVVHIGHWQSHTPYLVCKIFCSTLHSFPYTKGSCDVQYIGDRSKLAGRGWRRTA